MFRKILYPTDFSEHAQKALEYIKRLKEAGTEEVVILHVVHEYGLDAVLEGCEWAGLNMEECKQDVLSDILKDKEAKAQEILEALQKVGIKGIIRIEIGYPANKILEIAGEEKVSLIVMGAYGERKVLELLLGSVTEKVVRHSQVPVLVIR